MFSYLFSLILIFSVFSSFFSSKVYAVENPLSVENNKFGVHIISPTWEEASQAARLINSNGGDWGYVTLVITQGERNTNKWQDFFNQLRRLHLIPIVRIATKPQGNFWEKPREEDSQKWADFLDSLNWPTKNRYVVVYNEPNHAKEWGNELNPAAYAKVLEKTITALKEKSADFFILNAGFDASAPQKIPDSYDEKQFLTEMNASVPGIFEKLDGWVSHSYPNPGFSGSPRESGRGTVRTYLWEEELLKSFGIRKALPVFITETGWQHQEGLNPNKFLLPSEVVGRYFKTAFTEVWNDPIIVAVTPFLLNYQEEPFDHFSFAKILGAHAPEFYPQYQAIADLLKVKGRPVQENKAQLLNGEIYKAIVSGESYPVSLTFKNTGQSIWEAGRVKLVALQGERELGLKDTAISENIEPGQEYTFHFNLVAPKSGRYQVLFNLFSQDKEFISPPVKFTTEVKSPVILKINASLWGRKNSEGEYLLKITGSVGEKAEKVFLGKEGKSVELEERFLPPGYAFNFTLSRPFYKPKTVKKIVFSGANEIDFGSLKPDILAIILNIRQFLSQNLHL